MFSLYVAFATILFLPYPDISFCLIFGVRFLFLHIICVLISIVFHGFVPQFFTILKCRGTLALISTCFIQHIVCIHQKRTPTFHFSCFLGYTFPNCCSFYTTYGLYPQKNVPRHFFFPFFEVHILKLPLFCTTYSLYSSKTYPGISSFLFLRYTCPNCCSFYTTYGLYPQKNVPRHFFFPFFEVRIPKPPFISHNKYIVQFTQNLSKPLFITSFHKNNRPAFRSKRLFFQECFLIQFQVSQISS